MSNTNSDQFSFMSDDELKYLIDTELKKEKPNYALISKLTKAMDENDSKNTSSTDTSKRKVVITKKSGETVEIESTTKKTSFFRGIFTKLARPQMRQFLFVTVLAAFYVGVWYFRLIDNAKSGMYNDYVSETGMYDQNIFLRVIFGNFGLMLAGTFFIYYVLNKNFSASDNADQKLSLRVLSFLGLATIFDSVFLVLDFSDKVKFINIYVIFFALAASTTLKSYAYTLFFRRKDEDNYFIRNHLGFYARLTDFQFVVYLFAGLATMILGISAALVNLYKIDPWTFLFGFLLPFCLVCAGALFSLSYFNFDRKIHEEFSLFIKLLAPSIILPLSMLVVPVATVFFLIQASFLFTRVFEIDTFNNPTLALSQFYIFITLSTLIGYFILENLRPYTISRAFKKAIKFTLGFHLFYSIIGLVFATIGLIIRVNHYGFTNNRIFAMFILFLEFVFIVYTLFKLIDLKAKVFSDSVIDHNEVYKLLFLLPVITAFVAWCIFGVIDYDKGQILKKLESSTEISDFELESSYNTNSNYIIRKINTDLAPLGYSNLEHNANVLNEYLKDSNEFSQIFLVINAGRLSNINKYDLKTDVKDLFNTYKDAINPYSYYSDSYDYSVKIKPDITTKEIAECREDFYRIATSKKFSKTDIQEAVSTWDYYSFVRGENTDSYLKENFWRACFDATNYRY